jgi:metal-dependent amidase/aminoacylase/carboxypeptidase family protein
MINQNMGGEDFAFISRQVPSCMYHITVDKNSHWHDSNFKINPEVYFKASLKSMVLSALNYLSK